MQDGKRGAGRIPLPRAVGSRVEVSEARSRRQRVEHADVPDAPHEECSEVRRNDFVDFLAMLRRYLGKVVEEEPLVVREAHGHGGCEDGRNAQEDERIEEGSRRHFWLLL